MALSVDVLDACDGTAKGGLLLHAASVRQRLTFSRICEFNENKLWFEGAPLLEVDTMNSLLTSVTTINYSVPSSLVPEAVTEGGAVDDGTAVLARCATTTPAGSPRALMFDEVSKTD
jgi:hypothetical protein